MYLLRRVILLFVGFCLGLTRLAAGEPSAPSADAFKGASGSELVRALVPTDTRVPAFEELRRRTHKPEPTDEESSASLEPPDPEPETIVCPQTGGQGPLYVVLFQFLSRRHAIFDRGYPISRPDELFPPNPPKNTVAPLPAPMEQRSDLQIVVFDANGQEIKPFGGDNVLSDGVIADFTGSGRMVRADRVGFGIEGVKTAQLLILSAVEAPKARPLLAVLYNWGARESWGYTFAPRNDGTAEVRLGPKTGEKNDEIDPKISYHWDDGTKTFVGPAGGGKADHFIALPAGANLYKTVEAFAGKMPPFGEVSVPEVAPTAEATGSEQPDVPIVARQPIPTPAPPSARTPPVPPTLPLPVGESNEEIWKYFGPDRPKTQQEQAEQHRKPSIVLPDNFWTGAPRDVALALAELNRSAAHRAKFQLAVDARDGGSPPESGSIVFNAEASGCFVAADRFMFLRFTPDGQTSEFVALGTMMSAALSFNLGQGQPAFDLRRSELSGADARQLAAVAWWLDRVRSHLRNRGDESDGSMMMSTGDGRGRCVILGDPAGTAPVRLEGSIWSGDLSSGEANPVAERWSSNYGPETAFNLIAHLVQETLPARLGANWERLAVHGNKAAPFLPFSADHFGYAPEEFKRTHDLAAYLLSLPPAGQRRISHALLREAVTMAGKLAMTDLAPTLRALADHLPAAPPGQTGRTRAVIQQEREKAEPGARTGDADANQKASDRQEALQREEDGIRDGTNEPGATEELRAALQTALNQFALADNPAALEAAAIDPETSRAAWALEQLGRLKENARVAAVLERWSKRSKPSYIAQAAFAALTALDPARARSLARSIPADEPSNPLFLPAFALLAKGNEPIPEETERRHSLLAIVLDPKSDYGRPSAAVDLLVPEDDPGRYPDPKIEAALRRVVDAHPPRPDVMTDFLPANAAAALGRRGHPEDFQRIMARAVNPGDADRLLGAAARLLPRCGEKERKMLEDFLRAQLAKKTDLPTGSLFLTAWQADLRDLRTLIAPLATSGPEEQESRRASMYGGSPEPLRGQRFHMARQVAALWGGEQSMSAAAHVKALIAFGQRYYILTDPARRERLIAELRQRSSALTTEDRTGIKKLVDWAESKEAATPDGNSDSATGPSKSGAINRWVDDALGLP